MIPCWAPVSRSPFLAGTTIPMKQSWVGQMGAANMYIANEAADTYGAGGGGAVSATWASQQSGEDPLDTSAWPEYAPTRPMPPRRLRPRSSGGLVHSRAQCPTWPHLAHLLRDLSFVIDHLRGGAVRRGFFPNWLFFLGAFPACFASLRGGPRLLGRAPR